MARRPTTAEILAAARTAGGRRSAPSTTASDSADAGTVTLEHPAPSAPPKPRREPESRSLERVEEPAFDAAAIAPPSMASILRIVRGQREESEPAAIVPPAVAPMLAQIRGEKRTPRSVPASVTSILAEVRRACGTPSADRGPLPPAVEPAVVPRAAPADSQRPRSTADILGAARAQGGTGQTKTPDSNGQHPAGSRTASILAAARKQGGIAPGAASAGSAKTGTAAGRIVKPAPAVKRSTPKRSGAADVRPADISELLSAVRAAAARPATDEVAFPPLREMMAALRQLDRRGSSRHRSGLPGHGRAEPERRSSRFWRWIGKTFGTHRGASI